MAKKTTFNVVIMTVLLLLAGITSESFGACDQFKDQSQGDELRCLGIYLTDGESRKQQMVQGWLNDKFSGYPDLNEKIKKVLKNCASFIQQKSIEGVPLDVIEGEYRWVKYKDKSKVEVIHDEKAVVEGYISAWIQKNVGLGDQAITEFEKTIRAGCPR